MGVCLLFGNVHSQIDQPYLRFDIDLQQVVKIYDELNMYREAVWDTIPPFDYTTIKFGPRNKIPHFLKSDFKRYNREIDYFDGFRLTYTYPRVYSFDLRETTDGEFYTYQARDVTIPGLTIDVERIDDVAEKVRRKSFQKTWREAVVTSVTTQERGSGG